MRAGRRFDAMMLAKLYASNFLPEVWVPDAKTQALRRQVARCNQIVRQRVRLKTITQSILHARLLPQCPHADLFDKRRRLWLTAQHLPSDEREAAERHQREYDRLGEDLRIAERELARDAMADANIKRLTTIPGIDRWSHSGWRQRSGRSAIQVATRRVGRRMRSHLPFGRHRCYATSRTMIALLHCSFHISSWSEYQEVELKGLPQACLHE